MLSIHSIDKRYSADLVRKQYMGDTLEIHTFNFKRFTGASQVCEHVWHGDSASYRDYDVLPFVVRNYIEGNLK